MTHDLIESAPGKGDDDPFDLCLKSENRALLVAALEVLTEREKTVIQLYYQEELTMREIADILGFVVTRISQIHAGAILKMREVMKESQASKLKPRVIPAVAQRVARTAPLMRHA
jgi:RNA polymerase sigma factor for flagellar operon FliA